MRERLSFPPKNKMNNKGNLKHGETLKKHYCLDCDNEISYNTWSYGKQRCRSCAAKENLKNPKNHSGYINGKFSDNPNHCIDCNKIISPTTKRCKSCNTKYLHKIGILNSKDENNPNFGNHKLAGKNHWNWIDGRSYEPYTEEFNKELKELILKRDNYECQNCGMTQEEHLIVIGRILTIHHIDYDKKNCKEENLITTCLWCNTRANFNRTYWQKFYINKLIKRGIK